MQSGIALKEDAGQPPLETQNGNRRPENYDSIFCMVHTSECDRREAGIHGLASSCRIPFVCRTSDSPCVPTKGSTYPKVTCVRWSPSKVRHDFGRQFPFNP